MTKTTKPICGHRPDRSSRTSPRCVAGALRTYLQDEVAFTREELLRAREDDDEPALR